MTAAAVLALINCPSLTREFRDELLTMYRLTPEEAGAVARLVEAWGWEKNNRMSPRERRVEIRARVVAHLEASRDAIVRAPYRCHKCETPLRTVFFVDANDREICRSCFDGSRPPVKCEHCPDAVTAEDSLPTPAGGRAHAACRAKLTNAYGYQASARMSALGIDVLKGGRS